MQTGSSTPRQKLYGGIAASVALHVVIAGVLLVQLPPLDFTPPEEETVTVEMVAPPEEDKPEEESQEQALTVPEMEEPAPQEEQQPPPPEEQAADPAQPGGGEPPPPEAEVQAQEEQAAEPPPQQAEAEPPAPQQAEAPPPPPPEEMQQAGTEPQAEEQASAEPPAAPEPAAPEQEQAEAAQAAGEEAGEEEAGRGSPLQTLRPVFEYGEEASGSGMARGGNASEGEQAEESETADIQENAPPTVPDASEPAETVTADATPADTDAANAGAADAGIPGGEGETDPAAPKLPDDIETPSVDMSDAVPLPSGEVAGGEGTQLAAEPAPATADGEGEATPEGADAKPAEPNEAAAQDAPPRPARRLFSEEDTGSRIARTAMGNVPRDVRGGQLCSTELTAQLRNGPQRFNPDMVPSPKLPEGTVLDVRQASFRAGAQWYDIRFRCEVNENATRVVSFGLDIGEPVPRSEWKARRFPEY